MKYSGIPLLLLSLAAAPAFAADADISLTNDSAKGQINFYDNRSEIQLGTGYTYHEGSRHLFNVDFHAQGQTALGNLPATAGIGMRGLAWDDDRLDGGAVGLGGFGTVNIPDVPGLSLHGSLHYAPSILSFGDSDDMTSLELRVSYRVIRNAEIFGGYRYLNTDIDGTNHDINLDEGVLAGLKIYF
ncbi:YfaZ family outer membrane protein [Marinobacter salicampi]|uniref:YfaZ family outer membrane protein n=1 Tax=Marinobacter salicampi TaxID=435907 RepID=UPI00140E1CB7|nr:YfaZ family outer membrane protein [Marinobacter salicampi]